MQRRTATHDHSQSLLLTCFASNPRDLVEDEVGAMVQFHLYLLLLRKNHYRSWFLFLTNPPEAKLLQKEELLPSISALRIVTSHISKNKQQTERGDSPPKLPSVIYDHFSSTSTGKLIRKACKYTATGLFSLLTTHLLC